MRKNSFIQGALILTIAGIIVKFIGAFSRIYLSRLLGGEGIGLYQMAYPIYLLCLSVSSAGLPVAISIMVAERNAVNDYFGGQKVFRISMIALIMTGVFFSGLLFFGAQWLVDTGIVRDQRAYWSLLALSPAVFCATLLATLRGYFQGLQLMTPGRPRRDDDRFRGHPLAVWPRVRSCRRHAGRSAGCFYGDPCPDRVLLHDKKLAQRAGL